MITTTDNPNNYTQGTTTSDGNAVVEFDEPTFQHQWVKLTAPTTAPATAEKAAASAKNAEAAT